MRIVHVLLDADGQVVRWPSHAVCDWRNKAALLNWLAGMEDQDYVFKFYFVTNRPGSDVQPLAYDYRAADTFSIVENGCIIYDHYTNVLIPHPKFVEFSTSVRPRIMEVLEKAISLGKFGEVQQTSGRREITIEIGCRDVSRVPEIRKTGNFALEQAGLLDLIEGESGKAWVIYPKGCDKGFGLQFLETYYRDKTGQEFPWGQAIWIADGKRDIVGAEFAHKHGAAIAANGGSNTEYLGRVQDLGGIVAEDTYELGVLQILKKFLAK